MPDVEFRDDTIAITFGKNPFEVTMPDDFEKDIRRYAVQLDGFIRQLDNKIATVEGRGVDANFANGGISGEMKARDLKQLTDERTFWDRQRMAAQAGRLLIVSGNFMWSHPYRKLIALAIRSGTPMYADEFNAYVASAFGAKSHTY
jgi:hypothetical protein